ncbi:hypothetical protein [Pseudodesulfovibrio indicus]|uniref:hypothetical protein n=1 Tax=Pseudodesulfovibrio indicus TaxID=1716143 RepID=UPI00292D0501|nr:hypothetical protein [Pseudodesulfovibrio indicus]
MPRPKPIAAAVVLGVHSFGAPHRRTGIQYIAEGLARSGVAVDYISVPSSPLDILGRERLARLARVWPRLGRAPVAEPVHGLREFAFPSPVPVHRLFVPGRVSLRAVRLPAAGFFRSRAYDLCVHDVGPTMAYLPLIRARRFVLRLNDAPDGLSGLPPVLGSALEDRLARELYERVWAVSGPLAEWAEATAPGTPTDLIPNGVDAELFAGTSPVPGAEKRAVCLGNRSPWLDLDLLRRVAGLLPDWEIHCVGGGFGRGRSNLRFLPPVAHDAVPSLLSGYGVGLLPFRESPRMAAVERPLRFYEYVAAGLGVASTPVGGLRAGLTGWAEFGDGPGRFAEAVRMAADRRPNRARRETFLRENGWQARLAEMFRTLGLSNG